jgi:hypothetical protein
MAGGGLALACQARTEVQAELHALTGRVVTRVLNAGDEVEFDYELAQQDSFRFVVTRVRKV